MKRRATRIYRAAAVRDTRRCDARPGVVAVAEGRVLYAGPESELPRSVRDDAAIIDRSDELLMPAFVNAHVHLDLTDLGPRPYEGDFVAWLRQLMADRPRDAGAIEGAVRHGLSQSREAGVGWIGDVAGSLDAIEARRQAPPGMRLPGVSYLECFGIGGAAHDVVDHVDEALDELEFEVPVNGRPRGTLLGVGPHAPYSVGSEVYDRLARLSRHRIYRLTTHLAESPEELQFVRDAAGPLADLLRELDKWDETIEPAHAHPIDWLEPALRHGRWLVAHCNYVTDEHIDLLERTGTSVAYCPIASDYFEHPKDGRHRYQQMLDEGVNVCLGTDSILCQPADSAQPLGILPQMRHLYARDGTDPKTLLAMATTRGAAALEFRDADATLQRGAPAVFTSVRIDPADETDPLIQALTNDEPASLIEAVD